MHVDDCCPRTWKPPLTEEEKVARKEKAKRKKAAKSEDGSGEDRTAVWYIRHMYGECHIRKSKKSKKAKKEDTEEWNV